MPIQRYCFTRGASIFLIDGFNPKRNRYGYIERTMIKKILITTLSCISISHSAWAIDLVEAYQLALMQDATWQADQLRFQIEQQNLGIAKAAALPTVSINASY